MIQSHTQSSATDLAKVRGFLDRYPYYQKKETLLLKNYRYIEKIMDGYSIPAERNILLKAIASHLTLDMPYSKNSDFHAMIAYGIDLQYMKMKSQDATLQDILDDKEGFNLYKFWVENIACQVIPRDGNQEAMALPLLGMLEAREFVNGSGLDLADRAYLHFVQNPKYGKKCPCASCPQTLQDLHIPQGLQEDDLVTTIAKNNMIDSYPTFDGNNSLIFLEPLRETFNLEDYDSDFLECLQLISTPDADSVNIEFEDDDQQKKRQKITEHEALDIRTDSGLYEMLAYLDDH
jgi:hypothetical protein